MSCDHHSSLHRCIARTLRPINRRPREMGASSSVEDVAAGIEGLGGAEIYRKLAKHCREHEINGELVASLSEEDACMVLDDSADPTHQRGCSISSKTAPPRQTLAQPIYPAKVLPLAVLE